MELTHRIANVGTGRSEKRSAHATPPTFYIDFVAVWVVEGVWRGGGGGARFAMPYQVEVRRSPPIRRFLLESVALIFLHE